MVEVKRVAQTRGDVPEVRERVLRDLKDLMWEEVWRDEIDLPDAEVTVSEAEGGRFVVSARIRNVSGDGRVC